MSPGRDQTLPRHERRARGVYYTPGAVVRYIVDRTITEKLGGVRQLKMLDPSCGDGAFLSELARRVMSGVRRNKNKIAEQLKRSIFGIDCDAEAIELAKRNVAQAALGEGSHDMEWLVRELEGNFHVANALLDTLPSSWPSEFDAIVGNPPYVNIRRLAEQSTELVKQYRERFDCAAGAFDLYVLFIERSLELLRDGGRCGLIVPNKLATLDYAAPCRRMLMEQTAIDTIADLSHLDIFPGASVYPHVIVTTKGEAKGLVRIKRGISLFSEKLTTTLIARIPQRQLNQRGVFQWQSQSVREGVVTKPLGELCTLHSGTTGFAAQSIANELREANVSDDGFAFITSGNIDRYSIRRGDVRYMKRSFAEPVLDRNSSLLSENKRTLFAGPKIVIAGLTQRLEAAWDEDGLALGVQVFAAAEMQFDPHYLLAILNSTWMTHHFRQAFAAKRLGGGYMAINKGQLEQLPIVIPSKQKQSIIQEISVLAREASLLGSSIDRDLELDQLVYALYEATNADRKLIDTESRSWLTARKVA